MILEAFRLAFRNMAHRKRRSWLTVLGTLIGILAVVSLVSIGQGLENSIQDQFEELGGDKVFVSPGGGLSGRFSSTTVKLTDDDLETLDNTRGAAQTAGMVTGSMRAEFDDQSAYVSIAGVPMGSSREMVKEFSNIDMIEGRYLRSTDRSNAVVGKDAARDFFNQEISLRSRVDVGDRRFRVVGIGEGGGNANIDRAVVLPIDTARDVLDKQESYDMLIVEVGEGFDPRDVADRMERDLRQERDVEEGDEDFNVQTSDDIIKSFTNQLQIVRAVLVGIGAISLLVGGVGIMNTMYTSVTERTREIGIMKAIGATNRQVLGIFLIESGFIGMVGGLIGATLGIGISYAAAGVITRQVGLPIDPYVTPELILGALLFSFTVGMLSGILPARRAARMEPVEALRYS